MVLARSEVSAWPVIITGELALRMIHPGLTSTRLMIPPKTIIDSIVLLSGSPVIAGSFIGYIRDNALRAATFMIPMLSVSAPLICQARFLRVFGEITSIILIRAIFQGTIGTIYVFVAFWLA